MPLTMALVCEKARQAAGLDTMAWRDLGSSTYLQSLSCKVKRLSRGFQEAFKRLLRGFKEA